MKTKWQQRIEAELKRVYRAKEKMRKEGSRRGEKDFDALYGAEQALGWAMRGDYMAPSKVFR